MTRIYLLSRHLRIHDGRHLHGILGIRCLGILKGFHCLSSYLDLLENQVLSYCCEPSDFADSHATQFRNVPAGEHSGGIETSEQQKHGCMPRATRMDLYLPTVRCQPFSIDPPLDQRTCAFGRIRGTPRAPPPRRAKREMNGSRTWTGLAKRAAKRSRQRT